MSATQQPTAATATEPDAATAAYNEVVKQALIAAASALAAGITSLTFVAVVGGGITMARLRGAGLPTELGVAVQPRTMLLSVGAEALAAAFAFALGTVFVAHFVPWARELVPNAPPRSPADAQPEQHQHGDGDKPPVGDQGGGNPSKAHRIDAIWPFVKRLFSRHNSLAWLVVVLGFIYYVLWSAGAFHFPLQTAVALIMFFFAVVVGYVSGRMAAKAVQARDRRHELAAARAIEAAPGPEHARLARMEITYLGGLALAIVLYATVASVTASLADPRVRPAAVLFAEHRVPICGMFVAQDSDHLYIGVAVKGPLRNVGDHAKGRILDLPRKEVRALAVGSSRSLPNALDRRRELLNELAELHDVSIPEAASLTCGH
jgi:hypothetical protein